MPSTPDADPFLASLRDAFLSLGFVIRGAARPAERDSLHPRRLGPGHHRLQCLLPRRLLDPASARNISARRSPFALVW